MIRITTRLVDGAVLADIECADKNCLLDTVSKLAAENYGVDASVVHEGLLERERLGPTGFGGGTAIPHCKVDGIEAPAGVFVRLIKACRIWRGGRRAGRSGLCALLPRA
jgi:PTS system nitrogen regulatory IIA component